MPPAPERMTLTHLGGWNTNELGKLTRPRHIVWVKEVKGYFFFAKSKVIGRVNFCLFLSNC